MSKDSPSEQLNPPGSAELFRLMVENVRDYAIFVTDREGRIVSWNAAAERTLGYAEDEAIGQNAEIIFTPEDRERGAPERELRTAAEEGRAEDERWHLRKDGTRLWATGTVTPLRDEAGNLRGFAKVMRDTTERKWHEEELKRYAALLRKQTEILDLAHVLIRGSEDLIVFWNRGAQQLYGWTAEEATGKVSHELLQTQFPEDLAEIRARLFRDGEWEGELVHIKRDGARIVVASHWVLYRDGQGAPAAILEVNNDITERKRLEEEHARLLEREKEARAQAEEANRAKDEFLATLSHELRTPLTSILGWAKLLHSGTLDESSTRRALESIERNARAQKQLIDDLLEVSRIITGNLRLHLQQITLVPVIEAAVDAVRPAAAAKHIQLQVVVAPQTGPISGDADRLQQVIWNLLSNAIKFTPEGGRVEIGLERAGASIEIKVSDTGRGIEPEFLPYVFDRFRQADVTAARMQGGLGLGLAIVRHLVELHGGMVKAESGGCGKGATFTVILPLAEGAPTRPSEQRRAPATSEPSAGQECPPALDDLRVLVVDDEADTVEFLKAVLERCGAEVTAAASAREALHIFAEVKPDMLISDLGLPGEDGYSLIRKVRALGREQGGRIPAIALTAYVREEDRVKAFQSGYQMHLAKPVWPDELTAIVASFAGRTGKN